MLKLVPLYGMKELHAANDREGRRRNVVRRMPNETDMVESCIDYNAAVVLNLGHLAQCAWDECPARGEKYEMRSVKGRLSCLSRTCQATASWIGVVLMHHAST